VCASEWGKQKSLNMYQGEDDLCDCLYRDRGMETGFRYVSSID